MEKQLVLCKMEDESDDKSMYDCLHVDWKRGYEKEYFWISGILLVIVGSIGLLGNTFTMVILCQPQMRKKLFYNLLFALACFDTLFILSFGIRVSYWSLACNPNRTLVGFFAYPLLNIGLVGSIYMTVAISVERYLGICHPHVKFTRKAWVFIVPVLVVSFGFNFPMFFEEKLYFVNGTLLAVKEDFRKEESYKLAYYLWANVVCHIILPLAALICLNGAIIARINRTSKLVTEMGNPHQKQVANTTKILFCIVMSFLFLNTPRMTYKILVRLGPEDKSGWFWLRPVSRLALISNSSANFVIYSLLGRNFRKEVLNILRKMKTEKITPQLTLSSTAS